MQELIDIVQRKVEGEYVPTVSARNVRDFLGVRKDFTNWMKVQIDSAYLRENEDFIVYALKGENPKGGRAATEYYLTINAAKHICMLSRTPKGKELRDYFIQCEQKLQQVTREGSHVVTLDMPTLQNILTASITSVFHRLQTQQMQIPYVPKANYQTLADYLDEKGLERIPGNIKRIMSLKIRRFCETRGYIVEVGPGKHFRQALYYSISALNDWWIQLGERLYKQKLIDERNKVLPLFKVVPKTDDSEQS